jgi:hypothetical protein
MRVGADASEASYESGQARRSGVDISQGNGAKFFFVSACQQLFDASSTGFPQRRQTSEAPPARRIETAERQRTHTWRSRVARLRRTRGGACVLGRSAGSSVFY